MVKKTIKKKCNALQVMLKKQMVYSKEKVYNSFFSVKKVGKITDTNSAHIEKVKFFKSEKQRTMPITLQLTQSYLELVKEMFSHTLVCISYIGMLKNYLSPFPKYIRLG